MRMMPQAASALGCERWIIICVQKRDFNGVQIHCACQHFQSLQHVRVVFGFFSPPGASYYYYYYYYNYNYNYTTAAAAAAATTTMMQLNTGSGI